MISTPVLECIFCDDFRIENTGKSILIGCYGTHMYVNQFPFIIQKLCACLKLRMPIESPFKSEALISLYEGSNLLSEVRMEPFPETDRSLIKEKEFTEIVTQLVLEARDLRIEKSAIILAKATIDGAECSVSKLRIDILPQGAVFSQPKQTPTQHNRARKDVSPPTKRKTPSTSTKAK